MNVTIDPSNGKRQVKLYAKELAALTKARGIVAALATIQEPNAAEALGAMDKLIGGVQQTTAAETPVIGNSDASIPVPFEGLKQSVDLGGREE